MRAQSAALGIAAAAAFSNAASALPCAEATPGKTTISGYSCAVSDQRSIPSLRDQQDDGSPVEALQEASELPMDPSEALSGDAEVSGGETFAARDIKITNLQATMTSNKYVAVRLPLAARPLRSRTS
jgi:hypothetical protein